MHSGLITPEELLGLLFQEEERLAEERRSTSINTQFGSAPSQAMLTQSSSLLQPTLPLNTNQSSILCQPPLSNYLAHNSPNHAQYMTSPPSVFLGESTSLVGWHRQLAHPNKALLR
ncbi:hypothetical protein RDI58_013469 [Solanum bulbocastanum]|uniref:Uncharacterized protein n=1 Tax=Solanum bulbocastanum TaxID=147425 RepID=A0AAN8YE10_SOLBU